MLNCWLNLGKEAGWIITSALVHDKYSISKKKIFFLLGYFFQIDLRTIKVKCFSTFYTELNT